MNVPLGDLFIEDVWWRPLLSIAIFFLAAWVLYKFSWPIAGRLVKLGRFTQKRREQRPEREQTVREIIASSITFLAFCAAIVLTLAQFVAPTSLIWIIGLFSAAFGLGAHRIIGDILTGLSFIFEDKIAVGEKVEVLGVEGVVEAMNLRTMLLRSPTGELYIVPNGEVRLVRNFSRGLFSTVEITLKLAASDLGRALPLLEKLGHEAVMLLPNLLEPWRILSGDGVIGLQTEITLIAKARFGKAAEMRPRLLALVHERLAEADIELRG